MADRVALRTALFTALIPGTIVGLLPLAFLRSGLDPFPLPIGDGRFVGWIPIASGIALYVASAGAFVRFGRGTPAPFDPPPSIVTAGPYARMRNPIYVAVLAILAGEGLVARSGGLLLYAALLFVGLHFRVILREEPELENRFGSAWQRYRERVPRWLPGPPRHSPKD